MKIDLYNATGTKSGSIDLSKDLFEAKINPELMHRAVVMRLANARNAIAHVKTRSEVSATTKKMFRQKGTGNARRGSRVVTLLRGGGAVGGPRSDANFSKKMPKKERRAALFSSLTSQANDKNIFALEGLNTKIPKTKTFVDLLGKLPEAKKYLFVLSGRDEVLEKSMRNVPGIKTIFAQYLNPLDVLHAEKICFVGDALHQTENTFLSSAK